MKVQSLLEIMLMSERCYKREGLFYLHSYEAIFTISKPYFKHTFLL